MSRRRGWRATLALLGTFALVQAWLAADAAAVWLGRVPGQWRMFLDDPDASDVAPEVAAARELPRLCAAIPETARVLLVTSVLVRVQYEFWLLPRPFEMLLQVPPGTLDLVARARPEYLWFAENRLRQYEARGQVLTAERLRRAVARADYVVAFAGGAPEFDSFCAGAALERVGACGKSVLYRVRP